MTSGEYGSTTSTMMVEEAARACLDALMGWVGVDGLVAAIRDPGLLATIDQHAAVVRDVLGEGVTEARALAEYARQVHAAAMAAGHRMPGPGRVDWANASAYLLRLVAVCALAGTADRL
ncbi:DUF6401 family natural product biosynthesis protein [Planosporangium flavigriseum]|uniref:DUF6401 family natural product biosynthesis protein n=1 Tax=Planosporangium flavigriseum TaxID=373681 RepID=UPI001F0DE68B|nr:DUF6401 family natural product biosynthesis protein [Planosporangium flavigriseum]